MAASLGNATVNVLARTVLFEQSLKRSLKRMSALTAAVFAGVGAANFFGGAVKDAADLELRIARIHTLMRDNTDAQRAAFDAAHIREFSNELGVSADKVAESIYYMIGSGVDLKDAYDAVRAASQVAIATNTDLKFSSDFTSTALNAMSGTVDKLTGQVLDASHATDIFFAALAEGKGEPRELAQFISTAIPAAKGLAISYAEVNSAMAAGTLLGTKARKVTTGLSYIMRGLGNENKGVGEAFKEITGTGFTEWAKKAENEGNALQKAIKILGTEVGLGKISNLGGAETGLEAIKLLLTVWPQYVAIQKEVAGASGDADAAMETVNKTLSRQIEIFKNKFKNFRGSVGDWLGPVIYDAFADLQAAWPQIKAAFETIVSGIGVAFSKIGEVLGPAFAQIGLAFSKIDWGMIVSIIQDVINGILIGLSPLLAAIAGLIYAFGGLATYIQPVINLLANMSPVIIALVAAWTAYKTVAIAVIALQKVQIALSKLQSMWLGITTAVAILNTVAVGGLAGAWAVLTVAMAANPIGFTIAALVGLVTLLVVAWKKSETFRNIVVGAFNLIKDTVVTAVQVMVNIWLFWAESAVKAMKWVADAAAKLPDWLGGGIAADVSAGLQNILNAISTIRANVNALAADARAADWALRSMAQTEMASDEGNRGRARDFAATGKTPQQLMDEAMAARRVAPSGPVMPDFGGGGYSPGGGGAAAKGISDAAQKIKDALKRVFADLTRIAKNTSKQSVDTLKQNFKTLWDDLAEAGRKDLIKFTKKEESNLIKAAMKRNKVLKSVLKKYKADTLVEMAVARDKILDKLDVAKDKLKDLVDESNDFKKSIRETVLGLGDVSQASDGIGVTFTGIRNRMRKAIEETKRFNAAIKTLQKLKLNPELIRQLVEAGPEAVDQAATIAASGKKGVKELNTLQSQLLSQSKTLEKTAYDQFFKNGIAIAQGLVNGLEKERDSILKAMDKIADSLVARIKKKLNIKSPSRVFSEVGENITLGLAKGIELKSPAASKAAANVSQSIHFGPGSVSVSGTGNMTQRDGILTGQGIVQVLRERQIAAQLAGVQ